MNTVVTYVGRCGLVCGVGPSAVTVNQGMCRPSLYSSRLGVVLVPVSRRESDRHQSPATSGICIGG